MKISIPKLFKKYKLGLLGGRKEAGGKYDATVSSSAGPVKTTETRTPKATTRAKDEEEGSFMLTVEEIQASVNSLPKLPNPDSSGCVRGEVDNEDVAKRMKVVEEWIALQNAHDIQGTKKLMTNDVQFQFGEPRGTTLAMEFIWEDFRETVENICRSFTDFNFRYTKMRHVDGVIILQGFRACGTHNGDPFGFGPFEPLPAEGKFVENDPEEAYFYFQANNHKQFCRVAWYTMGDMTGPSGLYTQLGGFPLL
jgi:hypothetical protein